MHVPPEEGNFTGGCPSAQTHPLGWGVLTRHSKQFTEDSYLKVRMRIHSGEKPFTCNQRSKQFTASDII